MFVVVLKFTVDKSEVAPLMPAHSAWLQRGFDDGVFALTGSVAPGVGGMIVAHHTTRDALQARPEQDPLIEQHKVSGEISEIAISRADERLAFLKD